MLYIDTCVLLAVLTPERHSASAAAFLEQAPAPLAISTWSVTDLHSALGVKVRSRALSHQQAETVLHSFERQLASGRCPAPGHCQRTGRHPLQFGCGVCDCGPTAAMGRSATGVTLSGRDQRDSLAAMAAIDVEITVDGQ